MGAYVCTDAGWCVGNTTFLSPPSWWKLKNTEWKSRLPEILRFEFLENHPRRAMDRSKVSVGDDRLLGNSCSRSIEKFRVSKVKLTIFSSISKEMDGFRIVIETRVSFFFFFVIGYCFRKIFFHFLECNGFRGKGNKIIENYLLMKSHHFSEI